MLAYKQKQSACGIYVEFLLLAVIEYQIFNESQFETFQSSIKFNANLVPGTFTRKGHSEKFGIKPPPCGLSIKFYRGCTKSLKCIANFFQLFCFLKCEKASRVYDKLMKYRGIKLWWGRLKYENLSWKCSRKAEKSTSVLRRFPF